MPCAVTQATFGRCSQIRAACLAAQSVIHPQHSSCTSATAGFGIGLSPAPPYPDFVVTCMFEDGCRVSCVSMHTKGWSSTTNMQIRTLDGYTSCSALRCLYCIMSSGRDVRLSCYGCASVKLVRTGPFSSPEWLHRKCRRTGVPACSHAMGLCQAPLLCCCSDNRCLR
jgi:hypothetical protein